jgi:hypothetical protein
MHTHCTKIEEIENKSFLTKIKNKDYVNYGNVSIDICIISDDNFNIDHIENLIKTKFKYLETIIMETEVVGRLSNNQITTEYLMKCR